jgi:hypothetical protein
MKKKLFIGVGIVLAIFMIIGIFSGGSKTPVAAGGEASDVEIVSSNETVDEIGVRTVHVEIRNNSDKLLSSCCLKSIYFDESQKVVGAGNGTGLNIAAHATKIIDCMTMSVENVKTYKVQVEVALFE